MSCFTPLLSEFLATEFATVRELSKMNECMINGVSLFRILEIAKFALNCLVYSTWFPIRRKGPLQDAVYSWIIRYWILVGRVLGSSPALCSHEHISHPHHYLNRIQTLLLLCWLRLLALDLGVMNWIFIWSAAGPSIGFSNLLPYALGLSLNAFNFLVWSI